MFHSTLAILLAPLALAINFPFEGIQLTDDDVARFPPVAFGDAATAAKTPGPRASAIKCRAFPGDDSWPLDAEWTGLNGTLRGSLLKPLPLAAVCYETSPNYDAERCRALTTGGGRGRIYMDDPLSVLTQWPQGTTCPLPSPFARQGAPTSVPAAADCTQGGFPVYVVNATTARDVQGAVNFARNRNLRLVIKNTGHDFVGRNLGAGSLSVWTHFLKAIEFVPSIVVKSPIAEFSGYSGMAIRLGAGIEAWELYNAMGTYGIAVVAPRSDTVGPAGGWLLGGGHSGVSSLWGLGCDQILGLQIVTAEGRLVEAAPGVNEDLFYALTGGGGSTFGIVTSVVLKAYPAVNITVSSLSFSVLPAGSNLTFSPGRGSVGRPPRPPIPLPSSSTPVTSTGSTKLSSTVTDPSVTTSQSLPRPSWPPFGSGGFGRGFRNSPAAINSTDSFWQAVGLYHAFAAREVVVKGGSCYSYVNPIASFRRSAASSSNDSNSQNASDDIGFTFRTTTEVPNMSPNQVQALLQPLFDQFTALGLNISNPVPTSRPYFGAQPRRPGSAAPGNTRFASRLFPRDNFLPETSSEHARLFNDTIAAIRATTTAGYAFHGVVVAPNLAVAGWPANGTGGASGSPGSGTNTAWRNAVMHADLFDRGGGFGDLGPSQDGSGAGTRQGGSQGRAGIGGNGSPPSGSQTQQSGAPQSLQTSSQAQQPARNTALTAQLELWKAVTPNSGAYMNEANAGEVDWQTSFFGRENYQKLLEIKRARDPWGVFWAPWTVGSEAWYVEGTELDENGKLCSA